MLRMLGEYQVAEFKTPPCGEFFILQIKFCECFRAEQAKASRGTPWLGKIRRRCVLTFT